MKQLVSRSLEIILTNQHESGAFVASPTFPTYRYCWFRDGSVCALALEEFGHIEEAERFHSWCADVIHRYRHKAERAIAAARRGTPPEAALCLHSRFTLTGREVPGEWGHHQLDGLGTWLWAVTSSPIFRAHLAKSEHVLAAAALVAEYLSALWMYPCSDCWEENEGGVHTFTLAAVAAGLASYAACTGDENTARTAAQVHSFIDERCVSDGRFVKSVGEDEVDANLIGLYQPYGIMPWSDARFLATLSRIERELLTPGLHRYRGDTYYGGGEWVLLSAWLGLAYAKAGETQKAMALLKWVEAQASPDGLLPEQVPHALFAPADLDTWIERWGPIATPLLWSHAQYLLLAKALAVEDRA